MTALFFLVMAVAMMVAASGYRGIAVGLFGVTLVAAALWFNHDMTTPLTLVF